MKRRTITVDLAVQVPKDLEPLSKTYCDVLAIIESLYESQQKKNLSIRDERNLWNKIPEQLKSDSIPDDHLHDLKKGIFDLYPISVIKGINQLDLVVGKVFTSEGDSTSYYSGAAGIVNNDYKEVLEKFDSKLEILCENLSVDYTNDKGSIKDQAPDIKCLDVFSLAGAFDLPHKPICIFFAGDTLENISTLSNMTVFTNLYTSRFKALTQEIARLHFVDFELLEFLSDSKISELLLIWLRGHDVGHFIGEDNLSKEMSQFDKDYMILHELKSDIIALYSFRLHREDLLSDGMLEVIYFLTVSEMIRYIRRGDILSYPDSASAYLAWCYFEQTGAIEYDSVSNRYKVNFQLLETRVSDFVRQLLDIFKKGDVQAARDFVKHFGSLENIDDENPFPESCKPKLLELLNDNDIGYYLDYNYQIK